MAPSTPTLLWDLSGPQTKQNKQTHLCQPSLTVGMSMGAMTDRHFIIACWASSPTSDGPSETRRAFR